MSRELPPTGWRIVDLGVTTDALTLIVKLRHLATREVRELEIGAGLLAGLPGRRLYDGQEREL